MARETRGTEEDPPDERKGRRALTNIGGDVILEGDPGVTSVLAQAATPDPDSDPRYLTHAFHAWPGRMHPHTARVLVDAAVEGVILDPFMGGGTVPVEAMCAGRACRGSDLNPVALEVAWARTRLWGADRRGELMAASEQVVKVARAYREGHKMPKAFRDREGRWYDPPALEEVWGLAATLRPGADSDLDKGLARMLRACLSSILVKASRQASDSIALKDRDHQWIPKRRVESWFVARVKEQAGQLAAFSEAVKPGTPKPHLLVRDAQAEVTGLEGKVAAVITSPPYPGVFDYVDHHQRRYVALDLESNAARRHELGSRRDVARRGRAAVGAYSESLRWMLGQWRSLLVPGGRIYLVIGDGQHARGTIDVLKIVEGVTGAAGLKLTGRASQTRPVFGSAKHEDVRWEHVLALEVEE